MKGGKMKSWLNMIVVILSVEVGIFSGQFELNVWVQFVVFLLNAFVCSWLLDVWADDKAKKRFNRYSADRINRRW